jgi:hypothetical protein
MTFDDACILLKGALAAGFAGCPLTFENERPSGTFPPEPPAPWARIEFRNVIGEQRSIGAPGDNWHEEHGAMLVWLFAPQMGGDQTCRQLLDQIVAVFRGKEIGGVEVLEILGDDGGGTDESGAWWRRWRRIEFRYRMTA